MKPKNMKVIRTAGITAALALSIGGAVLFADQINTTIFNNYFQIGPADGPASGGDEIGSANILHSSDSNPSFSAAPDWADLMTSTGSQSGGGDDRTPKTPRGQFNPDTPFDGEGAF